MSQTTKNWKPRIKKTTEVVDRAMSGSQRTILVCRHAVFRLTLTSNIS